LPSNASNQEQGPKAARRLMVDDNMPVPARDRAFNQGQHKCSSRFSLNKFNIFHEGLKPEHQLFSLLTGIPSVHHW
jgi:hypothetical protein